MKTTRNIIMLLTSLVLLAGCTTTPRPDQSPTVSQHQPVPPRQATKPAAGSLYRDQNMNLYQDSRAHNVGDIVLVQIVETASAKDKATTSTKRDSQVTGDITSMFRFAQWMRMQDSGLTGAKTIEAGMKNDFKGEGETKRDSSITATISARIVEKTMDGNMLIRGFREIKVNNETQHIILSGLINPRDIDPDNSIRSTHVADARIEFSGSGVVSEKQQPGWFARGLDIIWPF